MPNRKVSDDGCARFTVTIPRAVTDELRALAAERGQKLASLMREAAYLYLRQERRRRERAS